MKDEITLFEKNANQLNDEMRRAKITLEAQATLNAMARTIKQAGGAVDAKRLAASTVGELAIMAAQNELDLNLHTRLNHR